VDKCHKKHIKPIKNPAILRGFLIQNYKTFSEYKSLYFDKGLAFVKIPDYQ
jgi:hypothetical protein